MRQGIPYNRQQRSIRKLNDKCAGAGCRRPAV